MRIYPSYILESLPTWRRPPPPYIGSSRQPNQRLSLVGTCVAAAAVACQSTTTTTFAFPRRVAIECSIIEGRIVFFWTYIWGRGDQKKPKIMKLDLPPYIHSNLTELYLESKAQQRIREGEQVALWLFVAIVNALFFYLFSYRVLVYAVRRFATLDECDRGKARWDYRRPRKTKKETIAKYAIR